MKRYDADLIERLRGAAWRVEYCDEAADEIERLTVQLKDLATGNIKRFEDACKMAAEIERLRGALKEAAKSLAEDEQEIERLQGDNRRLLDTIKQWQVDYAKLQAVVVAAEKHYRERGHSSRNKLGEALAALKKPECTCGGGHDSFDGHSHECALFALEADERG